MSKKIKLYVQGMHCANCELNIEGNLSKVTGIEKVDADLRTNSVEVTGDFKDSDQETAKELTKYIEDSGYTLHAEKPIVKKEVKWNEFIYALPIATSFIVLFFALQQSGILDSVGGNTSNYLGIFLLGITASLSSCMAVVGGLILSISANYAKEDTKDKIKPQILFHISRIIGFFIFGGIIGLVGSLFTLNVTTTFILTIIVSSVMILLGLNLLDTFNFISKLQIKTPKFIGKRIIESDNLKNHYGPLLLGALTFFLPCGFTILVQTYALTKGNFIDGASTMFVFALGTFPVLAAISFASIKFGKNLKMSGIFFKTVGIVVIFFALYTFSNALKTINI